MLELRSGMYAEEKGNVIFTGSDFERVAMGVAVTRVMARTAVKVVRDAF